jgi:hypothetical protein
MEIANTREIDNENSSKNHNKIARKPEEKTVMYKVEIIAKVYVFLNFNTIYTSSL